MDLEWKDCAAPLYVAELRYDKDGRRIMRQVNTTQLAERERHQARQRIEEARALLETRRARLRARGVRV